MAGGRLTRITARSRTPALTCPYCRSAVGPHDHGCACGVVYHRDCLSALARCVTIGCVTHAASAPPIAPSQRVPRPRLVSPPLASPSERSDAREGLALLGALVLGFLFAIGVSHSKALVWPIVGVTALALSWALRTLLPKE